MNSSHLQARLLIWLTHNPQFEWGRDSGIVAVSWGRSFQPFTECPEIFPQYELHWEAYRLSLSVLAMHIPLKHMHSFNLYGLKNCLMYLHPKKQLEVSEILEKYYGH